MGMTLKQAIKILKNHQKWRIGNTDKMKYTPKELTEAIDVAIRALKTIPDH